MRRIPVVDDDLHVGQPFKPATLLGVIDQCLTEAETHRGRLPRSARWRTRRLGCERSRTRLILGAEASREPRRFGERLS